MNEREVAKQIVYELNNLENRCSAIDKIAHSFTETQICIVIKCLKDASQPANPAYRRRRLISPLGGTWGRGVTLLLQPRPE